MARRVRIVRTAVPAVNVYAAIAIVGAVAVAASAVLALLMPSDTYAYSVIEWMVSLGVLLCLLSLVLLWGYLVFLAITQATGVWRIAAILGVTAILGAIVSMTVTVLTTEFGTTVGSIPFPRVFYQLGVLAVAIEYAVALVVHLRKAGNPSLRAILLRSLTLFSPIAVTVLTGLFLGYAAIAFFGDKAVRTSAKPMGVVCVVFGLALLVLPVYILATADAGRPNEPRTPEARTNV